MPLPIHLAHRICKRMAEIRKAGNTLLEPDSKAMVTVEYGVHRPVISRPLSSRRSTKKKKRRMKRSEKPLIKEEVLSVVLPHDLFDDQTSPHQPSGRFVVGGPQGDAGLPLAAKIIVDSYGAIGTTAAARSPGKTRPKVDRSGAYAARHITEYRRGGPCPVGEVELCYAIGVAQPVSSVQVDTRGTSIVPNPRSPTGSATMQTQPDGIINRFELRRPIYKQVAAYSARVVELDLP